MGNGYLIVELRIGDNLYPVAGAKVLVLDTRGRKLYELYTDAGGNTHKVTLDTPDANASLDPNAKGPAFGVYDVDVPSVQGYKRTIIHGVQIFNGISSIQPIHMEPIIPGEGIEGSINEIDIPKEHGVDLPKNQETDNFNVQQLPTANDVTIPNYITVHLGSPNANVNNVRVPFIDYIKNVASSEIFPTWPDSSLRANIYAQISFALNRLFTHWYRSKGYEFDITNSTAFDQYFVYGRNIFQNINDIVDGIFNQFVRRQGRREPFFTSYCNGTTSKCSGLSQWGTVDLANAGYTPIQILRYYYPNDIQIVESNNFTDQIGSFKGNALKEGASGEDVRTMQTYLNRISGNYPSIPKINPVNGVFGSSTVNAVKAFQGIFNLVPDGIIGKKTWYSISYIFTAVKRLAELDSEGIRIGIGQNPPTSTISTGSRGEDVVELQFLLNYIAMYYPNVPAVIETGVFDEQTKRSVIEFQKEFSLTPDGVVGPGTWNKLYTVYKALSSTGQCNPAFPGTVLRLGSSGENVRLIQTYLNAIGKQYNSIPALTVDGSFGSTTENAVKAFQTQFGLIPDGIVGQITWCKIVTEYQALGNTTPPTTSPQFPGTALRLGSRGSDVLLMQQYLNTIAGTYTMIPRITADGAFGPKTEDAVKIFQRQFGLTADGIIGANTWNKIVSVYNQVQSGGSAQVRPPYPGTSLRNGSQGGDVLLMQQYLNGIAQTYTSIPKVTADGKFGPATENAVKAFQRQFGLTADGIIGASTWNKIVSVYFDLLNNTMTMSSSTIGSQDLSRQFATFILMSMMSKR